MCETLVYRLSVSHYANRLTLLSHCLGFKHVLFDLVPIVQAVDNRYVALHNFDKRGATVVHSVRRLVFSGGVLHCLSRGSL